MSQTTFSDYEYSCCKKKTKRKEFLDVMEDICNDSFEIQTSSGEKSYRRAIIPYNQLCP